MVDTVSLTALMSLEGRRNPYPHYAELHTHGPICYLSDEDKYDVVVHGFDAADQVMRDASFRVMDTDYPDRRVSDRWRDHEALQTLLSSIFFIDGADHTRVRGLFSKVFTPRRVAALEPAVERIINARLDRLAELGAGGEPVDFMAEFALPIPSDVIGELLGVPEEDRPWFPERVRRFGAILDLSTTSWRHVHAADTAAAELSAYFTELIAKRKVDPQDDLISALVRGQAEDGKITDDELVANVLTMFNAGYVTTTHLIGNGLTLLLERPDAIADLHADPKRIEPYVEEILRYEPPTHFSIRWASQDVEVAGVPIREGARVLVLFGAANRDPNRFVDPDVFDPNRTDNQLLSFGVGLHYCLGAALSRLEGQLALPMLLRRFPKLAVVGEPGERTQLMLRGYETLPVTVV